MAARARWVRHPRPPSRNSASATRVRHDASFSSIATARDAGTETPPVRHKATVETGRLTYTPAMSLHLFAGLRVRDFQAARPWYERLLGEPTFFPHATEAVWTLAEYRSVYVVEHADRAGNSVVTIFLEDLDARLAAIAARGLEPDARETYSNGVRKALYRDPDGNELGFGGPPLKAGS